jgi:hypothetical protein
VRAFKAVFSSRHEIPSEREKSSAKLSLPSWKNPRLSADARTKLQVSSLMASLCAYVRTSMR